MSGQELSDAEISLLRERVSLAATYTDLTHHEVEALDSAMVRLRRYGTALFLSVGERQRLYQIFEKARCFPLRRRPQNSAWRCGQSFLKDCNDNAGSTWVGRRVSHRDWLASYLLWSSRDPISLADLDALARPANAENIQKAVLRIIDDEGFARSAKNLGKRMIAMDGQKNSAETIWQTILEKRARLGSFAPECIDHPIRQQPGDPSRILPVGLHRHS